MNIHTRTGIISMSIWILFIITLFSSYLYINNLPFSYFLDEETGGIISSAFFISWALIWFAIGRHYSYEYYTKKQLFIKEHKSLNKDILEKAFRKIFFSKIARMLSIVFFIFIPFYIAANINGVPRTKDYFFIGLFMLISIISRLYYI